MRAVLEKHLGTCTPPPSPFVRAALAACLEHTPPAPHPDAVSLWRLRDIAPLPTFTRGRVVLIGDAAHAALPWTGLGISAAAIDAQRLACALGLHKGSGDQQSLETILRKFDADRRPRGHAVQKASRASDGGQGGGAYRVGRLVLRVIPLKLVYGVSVSCRVVFSCSHRAISCWLLSNFAMLSNVLTLNPDFLFAEGAGRSGP